MSKTDKNLMDAFAGESQANRKYLAYARAADAEGKPAVAKLFRAAAASETVHALKHYNNAHKVGKTADNLQDAINGETHEYTKMYPQMIQDAKDEGQEAIAKYFDYVNKVEEVHAGLFKKALADPDALEDADYYICKVCGFTHQGGPMDKCPICGAGKAAFVKVEDLYQ